MAPTPLLLLDAAGRVVLCTGSLAGHAPEAVEGAPLHDLVPEQNRVTVQLAVANAVSPGIPYTLDLPVKTPSGEMRWYQADISPLSSCSEPGAAVLVTLSDITERRRETERLRVSEQLMTDAQGVAHLGTWEWDLKDPYVRWSEQLYLMYGLDPATHSPSFQDFLSRVHPDDREVARQATECAMREKQPTFHDERVFRPDGEVRHLHSWVQPVCDDSGRLVKLLGVCQDITERARAEEERNQLLVREQQARAVAEAAQRRAAMLAETGRALSASLEPEEVVHKAVRGGLSGLAEGCVLTLLRGAERPLRVEVAHVEPDREAWARAILERHPPELEDGGGPVRVVRTGQAEFVPEVKEPYASTDPWVSASARTDWPVRSWLCVPVASHGEMRGALSLFRHTGPSFERPDLELAEQLADRIAVALENALLLRETRQAVRVRDEFLSIASHELRTPLATLRLQMESLLRPLAAGELPAERLARILRTMRRQVERLTQFINNLLEVTRVEVGMQLAPAPMDLGALARNVVAQFDLELERASCPLQLRIEEGVTGRWDAFGLEQVLTNLLTNAVRYGAGHPVEVAVERTDGGGARLCVRDHGIGIAPQDVERIFGRFERAVSARHYGGLGLGLFIARQLVEAHGGRIRAESWPGDGSCFVVELPPEVPAHASPSAPPRP